MSVYLDPSPPLFRVPRRGGTNAAGDNEAEATKRQIAPEKQNERMSRLPIDEPARPAAARARAPSSIDVDRRGGVRVGVRSLFLGLRPAPRGRGRAAAAAAAPAGGVAAHERRVHAEQPLEEQRQTTVTS